MKKKDAPVFLERSTYRMRRVIDAIRLVPIFGAVLWIIPIFMRSGSDEIGSISTLMIYVFSVWLILIVSSFLLVRIFSKSESSWDSLMSGEDKSD